MTLGRSPRRRRVRPVGSDPDEAIEAESDKKRTGDPVIQTWAELLSRAARVPALVPASRSGTPFPTPYTNSSSAPNRMLPRYAAYERIAASTGVPHEPITRDRKTPVTNAASVVAACPEGERQAARIQPGITPPTAASGNAHGPPATSACSRVIGAAIDARARRGSP